MKKLITVAALAAFSSTLFAQEIPAPEYKNKVMFVDASNTLQELEKTDLSTNLKTNMTGKSEVHLVANGKKAGTSHAGSSKEKYIVKIENDIDPETVVELFKFEESKKSRKILVAEMVMGKDKGVDLPKAKISFNKMSDGVYVISPKKDLEPGEYCFIVNRPNISVLGAANSQTMIGYCFSVDAQ